MTLHTDTPARFADLHNGGMASPYKISWFNVAVWSGGLVFSLAAWACALALVYWCASLLWHELTRCDPCEWVQFDAPMEGW